MSKDDLIARLRALAVERRPDACFGCGMEHNCSIHGCSVILDAADRLTKYADAERDGRLVVLPPPAKFGEPQPECFYTDCAGIWCLGYSHNGDDEPTELCKRCWYCQDGDYADDSEEAEAAKAALEGGKGHA